MREGTGDCSLSTLLYLLVHWYWKGQVEIESGCRLTSNYAEIRMVAPKCIERSFIPSSCTAVGFAIVIGSWVLEMVELLSRMIASNWIFIILSVFSSAYI